MLKTLMDFRYTVTRGLCISSDNTFRSLFFLFLPSPFTHKKDIGPAWLGSTPRHTGLCTKGTLSSREDFVFQLKLLFGFCTGNLSLGDDALRGLVHLTYLKACAREACVRLAFFFVSKKRCVLPRCPGSETKGEGSLSSPHTQFYIYTFNSYKKQTKQKKKQNFVLHSLLPNHPTQNTPLCFDAVNSFSAAPPLHLVSVHDLGRHHELHLFFLPSLLLPQAIHIFPIFCILSNHVTS